jgi:sugar/nucleoside kinase (ribokinase family)
MKKIFARVKSYGATTSLDMAKPDPKSAAGKADWQTILSSVLPYVDIFLPSLEEILFMLEPHTYEAMEKAYGTEGILSHADGALLSRLSDALLGMGAGIVAIKLGVHGLYVRSSSDAERLGGTAMGRAAPAQLWQWTDREILVPCFQVEVAGTTGAGDCTIAGFLTALLKGLPLEDAAAMAAAVGACSVERADAVSGVPPWPDVLRRIEAGWSRKEVGLSLAGWTWDADNHCYRGPRDREKRASGVALL